MKNKHPAEGNLLEGVQRGSLTETKHLSFSTKMPQNSPFGKQIFLNFWGRTPRSPPLFSMSKFLNIFVVEALPNHPPPHPSAYLQAPTPLPQSTAQLDNRHRGGSATQSYWSATCSTSGAHCLGHCYLLWT